MRIIKIEVLGSNHSKTPCSKGREKGGMPIMVGTYSCHKCPYFDRIIVNDPQLPLSQATYYVKCNAYYGESNQ